MTVKDINNIWKATFKRGSYNSSPLWGKVAPFGLLYKMIKCYLFVWKLLQETGMTCMVTKEV